MTLDERIKALNDIDQEYDNDVIRGFGEALNIIDELRERIKKLEDKVQMKDFFWEGSGLSKRGFKNTIEVANYIEDLEFRQPKWVSVEERLPPKLEDVLLTNGNECKQGYLCQYWCKENEPLWNFADGLDIIPTHWMPLPEPPTTEESSVIEEG